jgi:hypothetical protein
MKGKLINLTSSISGIPINKIFFDSVVNKECSFISNTDGIFVRLDNIEFGTIHKPTITFYENSLNVEGFVMEWRENCFIKVKLEIEF